MTQKRNYLQEIIGRWVLEAATDKATRVKSLGHGATICFIPALPGVNPEPRFEVWRDGEQPKPAIEPHRFKMWEQELSVFADEARAVGMLLSDCEQITDPRSRRYGAKFRAELRRAGA